MHDDPHDTPLNTIALRRSTRQATTQPNPAVYFTQEPSVNSNYLRSRRATNQNTADQFTVTDISNALGMSNEEKTMSRVLLELRRIHKDQISQINVRNGKIFQYYYYIDKDGGLSG